MSERLRYLFQQYYNKAETKAERDELMQYISDPGFKNDIFRLMEEMYHTDAADVNPLPEQIRNKILQAAINEAEQIDAADGIIPIKRSVNWLRITGIAAMLALAITFIIYIYGNRQVARPLAVTKHAHDINPGGNQAVLTLADGTKIKLNDAEDGTLVQQGSSAVVKLADGKLLYKTKGNNAARSLINTMSTPRGGQYQLQLPDGTLVMLNAESSISYPTAFTGATRNVTVTGEAYFEVAKDKKHPFIVSFAEQKVEVLGTHFNIRTYAGQVDKTTLLEGAVSVSKGGKKQLLVPGQQAVFDTDAQNFNVKAVDTEEIVAWKNGLFMFDNTDIGEVMTELSRWYDINVVYKGAKPNVSFTGLIKRNIKFSKALKMLESTGDIKITIAGDSQVIIERK